MAISTSTTTVGGNFRCRLTLTTVSIGETLKYSLGGSGAGNAYYSVKTTTASTEYTAMKVAVDAYIADQSADGAWEYAFTADNGTTFDLLVPLSAGFIPGITTTPGGFSEISSASVSLAASGAAPTPSGTVAVTGASISISATGTTVITSSGVISLISAGTLHPESYTTILSSGSSILDAVGVVMEGTNNQYYGNVHYTSLQNVALTAQANMYESGFLLSSLRSVSFYADGAVSTQKLGSVNATLGTATTPVATGVSGSGNEGFFSITLEGIPISPPGPPIGSGNFNTGGTVRYSIEQEYLHGKGSVCLKREAFFDGIKQSGDCKVLISASPISFNATDYYTSGCSCTKNVPLFITRFGTGNMVFNAYTYNGLDVVLKSGVTYMPGSSGYDYTPASGNYTITTGNTSGVIPITITAPTGYNYYFKVSAVYDSPELCVKSGQFTVYVNNGV